MEQDGVKAEPEPEPEGPSSSSLPKQKLRELRAQLEFLTNADGSCVLEQGGSVLWCGVHGPGELPSAKQATDGLHVEVVYRLTNTSHSAPKAKRLLGGAVRRCVRRENHPSTMLTVAVQELQRDGGECAAALTCACLALLDSGVELNGVFCGVCVASVDGRLLLDPVARVLETADAVFTFAVMLSRALFGDGNPRVIGSESSGSFELSAFEAAFELACIASLDVFDFYRNTMRRKWSIRGRPSANLATH